MRHSWAMGLRGMVAALGLALVGTSAPAAGDGIAITFDKQWKEQGFLRLWSNEYIPEGARLRVFSDGTVSMFYRPLEKAAWDATEAEWRWEVSRSVIPTRLDVKGGDDRNLTLYFVFVDPEKAAGLSRASARRLLSRGEARTLAYVWGGSHERGTAFISPYGVPGTLGALVLRPAGTGSFSEKVDLRADYKRLFGAEAGKLVGIAVSADSDDTNGEVRGIIEDLVLR